MTHGKDMMPVELALRAKRFAQMPLTKKFASMAAAAKSVTSRCTKSWSNIKMPIRLSFGARWIPRNDHIGDPAQTGAFESAELAFVERFLKPGMTVLDIGAHHGLYSLLASKKVGSEGRIFAFEPSPRERKALRLNLALNWSRNVGVHGVAMGLERGETTFYLVEGHETGCNSLRPPDLRSGSARPIKVRVDRLDDWLSRHKIGLVDFIKLDVEGAELSALQGATHLLSKKPRPVLMVEIAEIRTAPWHYSAQEILDLMECKGFRWFSIGADGFLSEKQPDHDLRDTNLVAIPIERLHIARELEMAS